MRKLLALLLALILFCPCAQALTLPYDEATVLTVLALTPAQRALADALYTPIFNQEEHIELPEGTSYHDVSAAMHCLMQDYPELFHLGKDYTIGYYRDTPEYAAWLEPQYRLSAEEAAQIRASLYLQAYLMADAAPDALTLHDTLCSLTVYGGDPELRHTAVGALIQGQATCEGYAQALTLLYRMAGIPCGVVTGTAADSSGTVDRHAWCIADLDGYTLIDPTWNDQDALGLNTHWYYGLSTSQMAADHWPDEGQQLPDCGDQANWHRTRGYTVSTQEEADAALRRLAGGETVNLRIPDAALYTALAEYTHLTLEEYNQRHPEAPFYGVYSVTCSDAQRCLILQKTE